MDHIVRHLLIIFVVTEHVPESLRSFPWQCSEVLVTVFWKGFLSPCVYIFIKTPAFISCASSSCLFVIGVSCQLVWFDTTPSVQFFLVNGDQCASVCLSVSDKRGDLPDFSFWKNCGQLPSFFSLRTCSWLYCVRVIFRAPWASQNTMWSG